jgi:hypothetical protein
MGETLKVETANAGAVKEAIQEAGWLDGEPVIAAGQLRQGKAPSMLAMLTGSAVVEVVRPRRSKALPRHFVLAVTDERVVAFRASGGKSDNGPYVLRIREGIEGSWERAGVKLTQLEEGEKSRGGVLLIGGESIPVARPNLTGEPNTDELLATLAA